MFMRMLYDEELAQAAYVIGCQRTGEAIVIDPERDVDRYINLAQANGLRLVATAETHIHADFLSGSRELAEQIGAKVYVSDEGDKDWKYEWLNKKIGGGSYDHQLLNHGDTFSIGNIDFKVVHTPGHTPEHISFLVTDRGSGATEPIGFATGDFIFVGDLGRPDLLETTGNQQGAMEPAARRLFKTLGVINDIPDFVQVWPGHGAGSACGKALGAVPTSTLGYERRFNPAMNAATSESNFVDFILTGQPEPPLYFASMKRDNKVGPRVLNGIPLPPRITVEDLRAIDARADAIIDTRPWVQFRAGHLPQSLCLPLTKSFNSDAGSFIKDTEAIYLIAKPEDIEHIVRQLIRIGLDHINGWFDVNDLDDYEDETHSFATTPDALVRDAETLLASADVHVLDVRRATEFSEGHIPGATNIAHTRLASRLDELPTHTHLLVNCRSGARSARTCAFLERLGFETTNLAGGFLAWDRAHAKTNQ
jgi:hydroxyacylglutathione hydrolase